MKYKVTTQSPQIETSCACIFLIAAVIRNIEALLCNSSNTYTMSTYYRHSCVLILWHISTLLYSSNNCRYLINFNTLNCTIDAGGSIGDLIGIDIYIHCNCLYRLTQVLSTTETSDSAAGRWRYICIWWISSKYIYVYCHMNKFQPSFCLLFLLNM